MLYPRFSGFGGSFFHMQLDFKTLNCIFLVTFSNAQVTAALDVTLNLGDVRLRCEKNLKKKIINLREQKGIIFGYFLSYLKSAHKTCLFVVFFF